MSDKVDAGKCENCGIVSGDDVNWNFPLPATCDICGLELVTAGVVSKEKLEEITEG